MTTTELSTAKLSTSELPTIEPPTTFTSPKELMPSAPPFKLSTQKEIEEDEIQLEAHLTSGMIRPDERYLKLRYNNWTLIVPGNPVVAQQLLHTLKARRETCVAEHAVAQRRLHEIISTVNFLRSQVDEGSKKILDAERDIGDACQAFHKTGLVVGHDGCVVCRPEHAVAQRRLHEIISTVNFLRSQVDEGSKKILDAERDIGDACQAFHKTGLVVGHDGCVVCRPKFPIAV
ncbi:hypothetical protein MIND_00167000 [Mycena indigotica]|uniref:Uncharacterized protein n=1 Tax=Mycena indigotica TaxID=2126181 RepID=A0A8H6WL60_9AGAR|nr:uncharacterized protein MIND_00167000 [Mycena indigotica]KAF7316479.1 hypothetical protein MIND_00167000 [Mycena indigotica]